MRQKKNRLKLDTLFVLGAGASYSLSSTKSKTGPMTTPLDKDFIKALLNIKDKKTWVKKAKSVIQTEWLDKRSFIDHGLEEAIIKRVSQYNFLSSLHPLKLRGKISNADYLNHLTHLIALQLEKCRENNKNLSERFIKHVYPTTQKISTYKNRIITFNYDTILDKSLLKRFSSKRVYFDRIANKKEDGIRRRNSELFEFPLLIKLHGSANWRVDTSYFEKIIDGSIEPSNKVPIWLDINKRPAPNDNVSPLIIPPVPDKPITKTSLFQILWQMAYEFLHEAENIVIVGYSCPSTDTLAHSMFSHFDNLNLKQVTIVDPSAGMLEKFQTIFKKQITDKASWSYCQDFEDYIKKRCI